MNNSLPYLPQQNVLTPQKTIDKEKLFLMKSIGKKYKDYSLVDKSVSYEQKLIRQDFFGVNTNKTISDIMNHWDQCQSNQNLMTGLQILRDQELLKQRSVNIQKVNGKEQVKFIYNDYHQKNTNPGFSRNALGCFYTR